MPSFNFLLLWALLLVVGSCAQQSAEKAISPSTAKSILIRGMFEGQNDYRKWEVFLTKSGYTSPKFRVRENGRFQMRLKNLPKGKYQFNFGPRSKNKNGYWSFQIPVYKPLINLGWIPTTSEQ